MKIHSRLTLVTSHQIQMYKTSHSWYSERIWWIPLTRFIPTHKRKKHASREIYVKTYHKPQDRPALYVIYAEQLGNQIILLKYFIKKCMSFPVTNIWIQTHTSTWWQFKHIACSKNNKKGLCYMLQRVLNYLHSEWIATLQDVMVANSNKLLFA